MVYLSPNVTNRVAAAVLAEPEPHKGQTYELVANRSKTCSATQ